MYYGTIHVQRGAVGTDAYQQNRNLLLSPGARADTNPQLEIETDDVRCSHGATVGPIDEEQLFYLTSRGMTEEEAKALIVRGFIEPIAKLLPLEYAVELNRLIEMEMEGSVG